MLQDAAQLKGQGIDVVIATVDTHSHIETEERIGDLEIIPLKEIEYRGNTFEEMDISAVIERHPAVALVDELAHTNIEGSKNNKRYEDVIELLKNGISVVTAVNIQHIESLNDAIARTTNVQVRETVPDSFFKNADEIIDVDISIDTLRTRLRQGKIYSVEKMNSRSIIFSERETLRPCRTLAAGQVTRSVHTGSGIPDTRRPRSGGHP